MSIYKHKRTGELYRVIASAFSVELQKHCWVYMQLNTGKIFVRNQIKFAENFDLIHANPQSNIVPKEPHE